ncbi:RES domain-containing protein [Salinisphaera shabanensis E1L3A]|uniref:RES domain-containing protein n=1 Tax=Salinisphaera shabanensis E1L3A TaxID=1033802 RepID=U2E7H6_9GAMM|nr:RES family NAD+ phosphorylase [Salinisphaera shabanensis]ERJ19691.1 RES domain-containing protein [Salinisphaera shabanensis E1L3A]
MQLYCCPGCIGDAQLEIQIFPFLGATRGDCCFCGSSNVPLIEPFKLSNYFESLIAIYEYDPNGEPLVDYLKSDWRLFDHDVMDRAHSNELLAEILDDGDIVRQRFSPSPMYHSQGLGDWHVLRFEMLHQNRWFMDVPFDDARLQGILTHLIARDIQPRWFRARLIGSQTPFGIEEMGAPPKHLASYGRANPPGIPYLYLGSRPNTAVAEIRPHTGELVRVAEFELNDGLKLADFREPRKSVSPFLLDEPELIGQLLADIPFLECLGQELTRPVLPSSSAIDYIPSQYFCEFIKKCLYDGVIYRSSVSDGINLALFSQEDADPKAISTYTVKDVSVEIETQR